MGLGMFDTSDNSLMVYIFGPEKSRPFTQSVHSFVGVGFVAGSALSGPFLPSDDDGQKTTTGQQDVCSQQTLMKEVSTLVTAGHIEVKKKQAWGHDQLDSRNHFFLLSQATLYDLEVFLGPYRALPYVTVNYLLLYAVNKQDQKS